MKKETKSIGYEIIGDLIDRADRLDASARDTQHSKSNRIAMQLAARVLRVAAEQNAQKWGLES